jgi:hypothetical protein
MADEAAAADCEILAGALTAGAFSAINAACDKANRDTPAIMGLTRMGFM